MAAAPPEWAAKYIGLPYEIRGRGPDTVDCWGLCWLVLHNEFGAEAPRAEGVVWTTKSSAAERADAGAEITATAADKFTPVAPGDERPGDIIVLRIAGHPLHCGIVAAPGWMLHAAEDADTALERYDGLIWRNRVTGFHRLNP